MNQLTSPRKTANTPSNAGMQMPSTRSRKTSNSPSMKVLIVEDSALLREALIEILQVCPGLSFEGSASTQDEAISLLQKNHFDMLMIDIELVQGNGFEVIKATQLKTYPFPRPLYVVLTNHAHPQYREMAKQLGVNYFFDKSMDFELAIETIETEAKNFLAH